MAVAALIVAAGRGSRCADATGGLAKQYARLGGKPILAHTIDACAAPDFVTQILTVIHADDADAYRETLGFVSPAAKSKLIAPVTGGATRQESVLAGLTAMKRAKPSHVLIHDAARPFADGAMFSAIRTALETSVGAIAAVPLSDTLKRATAGERIAETIDRAGLWRAQTPQGFAFQTILEAHERAASRGMTAMTDDAALAEWAGLPVRLVAGSEGNIKITTPEDLTMAELRVRAGAPDVETRIGTGFDVHKFAPGDHVWLGGVKIAHTHKLEGHSDADVVLHALTDALLGAIGDGDIGQHFPPSDPKWKGAASKLFLEDAVRRVHEAGGRIINVDLTVLAEAPRIGPHREAMQKVIGGVLGIAPNRVGIKATTMETLGFIGRRDGMAAMATAAVEVSR